MPSMTHEINDEILKICQQVEEGDRDSKTVIRSLTFPCNYSRIKFWLTCHQPLPEAAESSYWKKTLSGET